MWPAFKRLSLGFALIALTSSVLLISDWGRRRPTARHVPHLALLQVSSLEAAEEAAQGMIDGLSESGFTNGQNFMLTRYNAEGDVALANSIAKEITDGRFDLVLTLGTLCLQAVANANKAGKAVHVFGLTADPFSAGVGLRRDDPLDHPKHLIGIGSMPPIAETFRLAKQLFPVLHSVGVLWNVAEANSAAQIPISRKVAADLGLVLLEANVDSSAGVFEAASSLVARNVQALWIGADVTILTARGSVLAAARKGGIPVFTSIPGTAQQGALFDAGANYHELGRLSGVLAGRILNGTDPAGLPVEDVQPLKLLVNTQALKGLRDPWRFSQDVLQKAAVVIDETGVHEKTATAAAS
jgi:putative tryptophan/tyrosine transport system substrate-binding protein